MKQSDSQNVDFEFSIRLRIKDFKAIFTFKKTWLIALAFTLLRIAIRLWFYGS